MSMTPHPFDERIIAKAASDCDEIDAEMERGQLGPNWRARKDAAYAKLGAAVERAITNASERQS